jgi:hypothetical protein
VGLSLVEQDGALVGLEKWNRWPHLHSGRWWAKAAAAGQACRLITDPGVTGVVVLEAGVVEELPAPEWW